MKTESLIELLVEITLRLKSLASEDTQFRSQLRQLAQAILDETDVVQLTVGTLTEKAEPIHISPEIASETIPSSESQPVAPLQVFAETPPSVSALPELTLGKTKPIPDIQPVVATFSSQWAATTDADLPLVESRCRLKAEGARWAASRSRLLEEGADFQNEIAPLDGDIISRAKALPDCFLWMCHRSGPSPTNLNLWDDVAGCFEAVADVLSLLRQIQSQPEDSQAVLENALDLLAEGQSALKVAIEAIDGTADADQVRAYEWLRQIAYEKQIYIQRHMRADDPAEPTRWSDLAGRIEAIESQWQQNQKRAKERRKLIGKVRHKLSLLTGNSEYDDGQWQQIIKTVEELLSSGLPASNTDLRELLLPKLDSLPDLPELPQGFQSVLREIDRVLANRPQAETATEQVLAKEVIEVAKRLKDRSMVLIGGDRRPASYHSIKEAFSLKELIWIETREHQSIEGFEPHIARHDVAVVLLAIRWSSHAFGEVDAFCRRYGKPLVRLPGGYNPNQLALQIMSQCSERLPVLESDN